MRHKTVAEFDKAVLQFCRQCCGRRRINTDDCSDRSCIWYDDMHEPRVLQLSLLPKETFFGECKNWFLTWSTNRASFWWFDMRKELERHMLYNVKFGHPHPNWWGSLSSIVGSFGYRRTETRRSCHDTRSDEFLWKKK